MVAVINIKDPLPDAVPGDLQANMMHELVRTALESKYLRSMARHVENTISADTAKAQQALASAYMDYRLGRNGATREQIIDSAQYLEGHAAGLHSGEMLVRDALCEVDKRLDEGLGQSNGNSGR